MASGKNFSKLKKKKKFRVSGHEKNKCDTEVGSLGDETTEGVIMEKLLLVDEEKDFSRG